MKKNFYSNQSKQNNLCLYSFPKYRIRRFVKISLFKNTLILAKGVLCFFILLFSIIQNAKGQTPPGLFMSGAGATSVPSNTAAAPLTTIGITNTGSFNQNGGSTFNGNVGIASGNLTLGMGRLSVAGKSFLLDDVGIGHNNPNARLDIRGGAFVISGENGGIGGDGPTRFIWIPEKKAFGAGTNIGMNWSIGNIGEYSFAFGNEVLSSEKHSFVFGEKVEIDKTYSFAFGKQVKATGHHAFAFGLKNTEAQDSLAFAFGNNA